LKRITIKDIAQELDVHHSTVSRALRNDKSVSDDTRKRVNEFAREIGYQVNMNALQLRGSVKNMIAILVPNIHHNFFSNIVSVVANLAFQKGFIVSIFQSNENYLQEKEIIKTLIRNNYAGVIASISMETINSEHFRELKKFRIPLVLFDRVCSDLDVPKVLVNNSEAVASAVDLLIKRGFKRIAHISGTRNINVFRDRQDGYISAIKKNRLHYQKIVIINSAFTTDEGKKAAAELFQEKTKPDAIICDSHFLTLGAIYKIQELNLKIPEEIGMVGFSDNPYVEAMNAGVISIVQPDISIANTVFEMIIKKIEKYESDISETYTIAAKIIER
jgi:LacI family transcriptional regulator